MSLSELQRTCLGHLNKNPPIADVGIQQLTLPADRPRHCATHDADSTTDAYPDQRRRTACGHLHRLAQWQALSPSSGSGTAMAVISTRRSRGLMGTTMVGTTTVTALIATFATLIAFVALAAFSSALSGGGATPRRHRIPQTAERLRSGKRAEISARD